MILWKSLSYKTAYLEGIVLLLTKRPSRANRLPNVFLTGETSSQPERAADEDKNEARTPPEIHEHFVSRNINCVNVVTTGAKVASEKEIAYCLGGSVDKEPKTKPDQEPIFSVKNERALLKEGKTATRQEVTGATNLAKGSTKVNICKLTLKKCANS